MANNREDVPIGAEPTLDGGGEVPGRAYSSVQRLALLSCSFLSLTYSVAIDGTVGAMTNNTSENPRSNCRYGHTEWVFYQSGKPRSGNGQGIQKLLTYGDWDL